MGGSFSTLLYWVPYLLVDAAGLTYAIAEWRRHPRLSLLVTLALGLSLARMVFMNVLFPSLYSAGGAAGRFIIQPLITVSGLASYGLLLFAAFYGFREGRKAGVRSASL